MSSLQQINVSHEPEQDRLLLRASTAAGAEYRLWLTRRYTALLLQVLQRRINAAGGMQQLAASSQTTKHLRQGALEQPWDDSRSPSFPLGADGVLGYSISTGDLEGGLLNLQLLPREGQGLNLTLDQSLLYLLHSLLEQSVLQADWNLPLASATAGNALH
jgi:hypothetical protein